MSVPQINLLNGLRLEQLQRHALQLLVNFFKRRWVQSAKQPWDDDTPASAALLKQQMTQPTLRLLGKPQQQQIAKGDTAHWDITTLLCLLTTLPRLLPANKKDRQFEMGHWTALRTFRNGIAHHPSKSFTAGEFETHWSLVQPALLWLGADADTLQQLKSSQQPGGVAVIPPKRTVDKVAQHRATELRTTGNTAHEQQRYEDAIQLYSEGLLLPGLSDNDYAKLLSNRSASYLARHVRLHPEQLSSLQLTRAESDAKEARDRCPDWWRPHFRLGRIRIHQQQFERAIRAFDKALALSPGQQETTDFISHCRQLLSRQERKDNVDHQQALNRQAEMLRQFQQTTGVDVLSPEFAEKVERVDPASGHVMRGHRCRDGLAVEQNYNKAADHYAKAAEVGHAEGMYALGQLYFHGHIGERPNYTTALRWFRKAAAQPSLYTRGLCNVGVAEAQHSLGLCYDDGIGVAKSQGMALEWYKKSSSNGSAEAANNLGVHHSRRGELDKAQQYWELAADRGCVKAMLSLSELCLRRHDAQMAVEWNNRAAANGSAEAAARLHEFNTAAQQEKEKMQDGEVVEWERRQGLSSDGYNSEQRLHRWLASTRSPSSAQGTLELLHSSRVAHHSKPAPTSVATGSYKYDIEMLKQYQTAGSATARRMLIAVRCFIRAINALEAEECDRVVLELGECFLLEHIVATMAEPVKKLVMRSVDLVLAKCQLQEPSKLDEYARICYSILHMEQPESVITFLQLCISRYPSRAFFHQLLGAMHGFLQQFDVGVRHLNDALALAPGDHQVMYEHAAMLRLAKHSNPETVMAGYLKYLDHCPSDDRKVPEACYAIAVYHVIAAKEADQNGLTSPEFLKWYSKGREAETRQLPCFLPYSSANKDTVDRLMKAKVLFGRDSVPLAQLSLIPAVLWKPPGRFTHPKRVELIRGHRAYQQAHRTGAAGYAHTVQFSMPPALRQEAPPSLVGLHSLLLSDMDPTHEKVWVSHVLSLTVIDAALCTSPSIHLVVEDDHGNAERLFLYNFPRHEAEQLISERFVVGCKMAVINPYLRLAMDGKPGVRVDDYKSIVSHPLSDAERAVCWFCLTTRATKVCSKCRLAQYCSKQCQQQDWKLYDHKRICVGRPCR